MIVDRDIHSCLTCCISSEMEIENKYTLIRGLVYVDQKVDKIEH